MRFFRALVVLGLCVSVFGLTSAAHGKDQLKVTLLGTGTPYPEADRFGSAILVEAGGQKILFDCGRGAIIRLTQAGINASDIDNLYLTHLHSDHVSGIPDLWLTGWFLGRTRPLRVWGPEGTSNLARHLVEAFAFDVQTRVSTENLSPKGAKIDAHEIEEGKLYGDGSLRVTAFTVDHGPVKPALGYRIDYGRRSVVISGDTRFSQNLINFAKGADCLIHAAWSVSANNPTPPSVRSIASAEDAVRVFTLVQPRLAVVYHYKDTKGLTSAISTTYKGSFVVGKDLMTIVIDRTITWTDGNLSGTVE